MENVSSYLMGDKWQSPTAVMSNRRQFLHMYVSTCFASAFSWLPKRVSETQNSTNQPRKKKPLNFFRNTTPLMNNSSTTNCCPPTVIWTEFICSTGIFTASQTLHVCRVPIWGSVSRSSVAVQRNCLNVFKFLMKLQTGRPCITGTIPSVRKVETD